MGRLHHLYDGKREVRVYDYADLNVPMLAKRWSLIADDVPHLPERRDIGRALTLEVKARLLAMAAAKPEWNTARVAAILALNTTMRGCELKGLRWGDVDFIERTVTIRRSKTAAGERVIPLNANA